jgi:hypothetical protein
MRRSGVMVAGLATALFLLAAPGGAEAQQAGGWWDWALPEVVNARDGRGVSLPDVILGRGGDRQGNARKAKAGPPFCQNGQGHPVHGRQWCRDKGFGTGGILNTRWDTRGWDDVVLRAPRGQDRRQGAVNRGGLIDILGDVVFGRLVAEGSQLGGSEPLNGRWVQGEGGAQVLQIRSGTLPVAELTDLNGNGRADAVLISRR